MEPPPPEPERKHAEEPKRKDRYKLRREEHEAKQEFEPTASVLMFGRRKKPKSP